MPYWLLALIVVAGEVPEPPSLTVPQERAAKARELVRQLGSPVYRDRDRATRELAAMGRFALPALAVAATDADTEVRHRAGWLLTKAEADDLRARTDAFLADPEGRYRHDLPGWAAFRAAAGDDRGARSLFAEVVKNPANHDLLLALRGDGEVGLAKAIADRRQALYLQNSQPLPNGGFVYRPPNVDVPDAALLLLAESLVPEKRLPLPGGYSYSTSLFLQQPAARELMTGPGASPLTLAVRRLAYRWLDTRDGPNGRAVAMSVAQNLNLPADVINRYAARVLTSEGVQLYQKPSAVAMLAKHDGKAYLPAVTALFRDDTRLLFAQNGQVEVQLRDFALAMALVLTGQDPKEYGLGTQPGSSEALKFTYTYHRFYPDDKQTGEQKRAAAFARWRTWEAAVYGAAAGPAAVAGSHVTRFDAKK